MNLSKKLAALYEERANINEQIAGLMRDPKGGDKLRAALDQAASGGPFTSPQKAMAGIMAAAMPTTFEIQKLEEERDWTEKQILAILGNPALAREGS